MNRSDIIIVDNPPFSNYPQKAEPGKPDLMTPFMKLEMEMGASGDPLTGDSFFDFSHGCPPLLTEPSSPSDSSMDSDSGGSYCSSPPLPDMVSSDLQMNNPDLSPPFASLSVPGGRVLARPAHNGAAGPAQIPHMVPMNGANPPSPPPLVRRQSPAVIPFTPLSKNQGCGPMNLRGRRGSVNSRIGDMDEALRKRRLARKAELARISRKRKKERLSELEVEVVKLRQELHRVRKKHKLDLEAMSQFRNVPGPPPPPGPKGVGPPSADSAEPPVCGTLTFNPPDTEVNTALQLIIDAAEKVGSQKLSQYKLTKLIDGFVTALNKLDKIAEKHTEELTQSSDVPLPIRFLQWAMSQDESFFAQKNGLWAGVFEKIGFSNQQMQTLMGMRDHMKKQRNLHREVRERGTMFRDLLKQMHEVSAANFSEIRSIFTERQLAKFFVWVETNKLCVQVLTEKNE